MASIIPIAFKVAALRVALARSMAALRLASLASCNLGPAIFLGENAKCDYEQAARDGDTAKSGMENENQDKIDRHPGMSKYAKTALLPKEASQSLHIPYFAPVRLFFSRSAAERSSILRMEALNLRSKLNACTDQKTRAYPFQHGKRHQGDYGGKCNHIEGGIVETELTLCHKPATYILKMSVAEY